MHFNNARAVIVNKVQRIVNIILYRQSVVLFVNTSIHFEQISIQIVQINIFNSKDYYDYVKSEYKINDCSKMNQLMNNNLIHFNKRKRMCFDRAEQKEAKIHLQYKLSCIEPAHQCL